MRSFVLKTSFALGLLTILLLPKGVFADTLLISPNSGSYTAGQTFSVRLMVSTPQQAVNAASGVLSFPTDKLQVISVSKAGSILSLWVQEPSFSNSLGTVTFEGVVPNPGYRGTSGTILTVNFKVVGTGTANVRYSSGSLLANDGYGTNILSTLGPASFTLSPKAATLTTPPPVEPDAGLITTPIEDSYKPEPVVVTPPKVEDKSITLNLPTFTAVEGWVLKFFSIAIPLLALLFLLTHTWTSGVGSIQKLRRDLRKDLHNIDRLVEKSFDIIKEDISESIGILERAKMKRKLTPEEDTIIHRLKQNLIDAERIIHKEVSSAEKDLGN